METLSNDNDRQYSISYVETYRGIALDALPRYRYSDVRLRCLILIPGVNAKPRLGLPVVDRVIKAACRHQGVRGGVGGAVVIAGQDEGAIVGQVS